jgi:hypothetical protein
MRYIKYFENTSNLQQPFLLVNDRLYLSDDVAKSITKWRTNRKDTNIAYVEAVIKRNHQFFNNERTVSGYATAYATTDDFYVRYDNNRYRMNIIIYRGAIRDNEFGHFQYYIGGNSGDYSMHAQNTKRITRKCNLSFMIKLYPIVEHIKDFYKKMKSPTISKYIGFFDIIKDAIKKDNSIVQYGVPDELIDDNDVGYLVGAYKYNL